MITYFGIQKVLLELCYSERQFVLEINYAAFLVAAFAIHEPWVPLPAALVIPATIVICALEVSRNVYWTTVFVFLNLVSLGLTLVTPNTKSSKSKLSLGSIFS